MKAIREAVKGYWNPIVETLPLERLRELQVLKFKRILEWAYEKSRFHRRLYQEAGLEPEDIKSYEDVAKVPKVEKAMMREIQRKDPFPYGDALCVPLEDVTEFRQTKRFKDLRKHKDRRRPVVVDRERKDEPKRDEKNRHTDQSHQEGCSGTKRALRGGPAVERNAARILASVKMLEINISDVLLFTTSP